MPLPNRVDPWGNLVASAAKGTLMGNRGGRIHRPDQTLGQRRWASTHWIACELSFKGRHRRIWGDSYTELFFLDDVTALAAGHRPCFECRRGQARAFLNDRTLPAERQAPKADAQVEDVPSGAMVEHDDAAFARRGDQFLRWSFGGYSEAVHMAPGLQVKLLTPPLITAILKSGYQPRWHATAQQWDD
jgi:hypothetical protein